MWPVTPIGIGFDVHTRLLAIFTAGLVFVLVVLVVLAVMVARLRKRHSWVTGECPDDPERSRALVLVHRTPDGCTVVDDCSHWHDGRPDTCRQRCIANTG